MKFHFVNCIFPLSTIFIMRTLFQSSLVAVDCNHVCYDITLLLKMPTGGGVLPLNILALQFGVEEQLLVNAY